MAQPLKLSIGVNIDAAGAKTGGAEAQQAVAAIGNEAQRTQTKLQQLVNATVGLNTGVANGNLKEWSGALAMQGRSADELRAKYNPLFAVVRSYKQQLTEIRTLHSQGVLSSNEMVAAISRERQATLASIEAIKGRGAALRQAAANANGVSARAGRAAGGGNAAFQTSVLAAQAQDTVVTALMGMPSWQIGMQQGLQAATVVGTMEKPVQGVVAALRSLASVQTLVTVGAVTAAAAGIQWLTSSRKEVKTLDDALAAHKENIETLTARYGALGEAVKISGNLGGSVFGDASLRQNESLIRAVARRQNDEMLAKLAGVDGVKGYISGPGASVEDLQKLSGPLAAFKSDVDSLLESARRGAPDLATFQKSVERTFATLVQTSDNPEELRRTADAILALGDSALSVDPKFKPFENAINRLKVQLADGRPDLAQFHTEVERIGRTNGLQKLADEVIVFGKEVMNLNKWLAELLLLRRRLFDDRGPNGFLLSQGTTNRGDMGNFALYESRQRVQLERNRKAFEAEIAALSARSPNERAEIARQTAAADIRDESVSERRQRIELAGARALVQAEKELAEARRDRIRSMTEAVEGQQLELTLIGKTVSEAERLRMEHRLTAQAKAEAAKNGVEVDQEELRLIGEKSRAYGQLAEEIAAINILRGQQSSLEQLRLETALVGQSEETRRRALALLQAEQQIRQQGITADSARAEEIRKASLAIADQTAEVERLRDAWGEVQGAIEGVIDGGVDALTQGNWKGALDALKKEIVGSLSTIGIKNPLMNAIDGGNRGTISDLGGIGGLVTRLLGGGRSDATSLVTRAMGQSVGAMTVTAGTVMINGGVSGSLLGGLKSLVPGNDNGFQANTTLSDMLGIKGAGGALGFVGRYKSGVDPRLTDILQEAASRFPGFKVDAISGYRPGDPRYHGGGLATDVQLTDLASGRLLGNYQDAASFRAYEQFAQVSRQIQMAKYPELADKFRWGGYFSGGPGKYGALDTMHFDLGGGGMAGGSWAGGLTSAQASLWPGIQSQGMAAADALKNLAGQGDIAAQGLGALGSGFDKFGNVLAGLGNGGGASGGGLMGLFGNLFSPSFTPNTTLGSFLVNGWSSGGWTGGTDPSRVAGLVHEKEFVFDAPSTARIGVHNLEAMRRGIMPGYRDGGYVGSRTVYPVAAMAPVRQEASAPLIQIINNSSAQVDGRIEDAGTDERGRRQYRMVMSDAVADGLATPGGRAGRTLRDTYNVRKRGIAR